MNALEYWAAFRSAIGASGALLLYEAFHFGDNEALANELAGLVLGSLEYWRSGHWQFFGRECLRLGKEPSASMLVVCERFKVIYRAHPGN